MDIEYWTDPFCIWAFTAEPQLNRLVENHGDRITIRYRIVPVFGSIVRRFATGAWSEQGPAGRAAATARIAAEHRPEIEVTGRVWIDDPPASSFGAAAAFEAVQLLEAEGLVEKGAAARYLSGLRHRFFVDNVNLARRDARLALAEDQGLPVAALAERIDDGRAMAALFEDQEDRLAAKVVGSPTYLFDGGRTRLYGNFRAEVLDATVRAYLANETGGGSAC